MKIEESNKLIAEFLEMQKTDIGWFDSEESLSQYIYDETGGNCHDYLLFDKDYNWLMSVVEKIESIYSEFHGYFGVYINSNSCTIQGTRLKPGIVNAYYSESTLDNKLNSTYNCVVEFIKWYNDQEGSI